MCNIKKRNTQYVIMNSIRHLSNLKYHKLIHYAKETQMPPTTQQKIPHQQSSLLHTKNLILKQTELHLADVSITSTYA
jgi:hypothetical protein